MRSLASLAILASLLAGCAGSSSPSAPAALPDPVDPGACVADCLAQPAVGLPWEVYDLTFDGRLPTGARACAPNVACTPPLDGNPRMDNFLNVTQRGQLRTVSLNMTWEAGSFLTERLAFGIMVMDGCSGCNVTILEEATGTSPLQIDLLYLDVPVGPGNKLHVFAYNPSRQDFGAARAATSVEQHFRVEGFAEVEPMPAA
ncbi:MAG TPA: hypothetical protein VFH47_01880 [Candidatus Thermoplasmatota archaeon]|nr:hypothetical protein [Candidatus Thermoplasmatota archaeon]